MISIFAGISRLISNISPLLLLFVFTKTEGIEEIGLFNYFLALITIVGVLTDFGLPEAVQSLIPKSDLKSRPGLISRVVRLELILVASTAIAVLFLDKVSSDSISRGYPWLLAAIILTSSSNVLILTFNGLGRSLLVSIFYLGSSTILLILSLVMHYVWGYSIIESLLWSRLISWSVFVVLPLLLLIRSRLLTTRNNFELKIDLFRFAKDALFASLAYVAMSQLDSILVTNFHSLADNGVYKSAVFAGSIPVALSTILQTKLIPQLAVSTTQEAFKIVIRYLKLISVLALLLVVLAIFLGKFGLTVMYNSQIAEFGFAYLLASLLATMLTVLTGVVFAYFYARNRADLVRDVAIWQLIVYAVLAAITVNDLSLFATVNTVVATVGFVVAAWKLRN